MLKVRLLLPLGLIVASGALADEGRRVTATFETGQFQRNDGLTDPFFVQTLTDSLLNAVIVQSSIGGGGPGSNWDTKVVASETVGGQFVTPRRGKYFMRSALYFNKDYSGMNKGENKPRAKMPINGHPFQFDEEGWLGFSVFLPRNWEPELGTKGIAGYLMLLETGTQASSSMFVVRLWTPSDRNESHWFLDLLLDDKSIREDASTKQHQRIDLGPAAGDLGKWTDFVIRYRSNPFSQTTNPAKQGIYGAKNQTYEGNKGIFQLWKSGGAVDGDGNRKMALKIDKKNTPIGLVPRDDPLVHRFKSYKGGWHKRPTTVKGPVWVGFDEIRFGRAADGINYADVHPAQLACTDGCPAGSDQKAPSPPDPPKGLVVAQ
jgi:hypothetical protein